MDRNSLLGLLLIGLVLMAYQFYVSTTLPPPEEAKIAETEVVEQNKSESRSAPATNPFGNNNQQNTDNNTADNTAETPNFNTNQAADTPAQEVILENDKLKLTLSNIGGQIKSAELKEHKTSAGEPLILFDGPNNSLDYQFSTFQGSISTQRAPFKVERKGANAVAFKLDAGNGSYLEQVYTLKDGDYMLDYDLNMVGFDKILSGDKDINLIWETEMLPQERKTTYERSYTTVYYKPNDDDVSYLSYTGEDEEEFGKIKWVGNKQQFFSNTLIADDTFDKAELAVSTPEDSESPILRSSKAKLGIEHNSQANFKFPMQMYLGPTQYTDLKTYNLELEEQIYFGWSLFAPISRYIIIPLFQFFEKFTSNYGIIILLLTLLIKFALMPLTFKSYQSMARMNAIKPEMNAIKEKYKDDPKMQQTEQMQLFSKAGVNPLGGCLPQLIQFPFLISMFYFFPSAMELRQKAFLWAPDLSSFDSILSLPFDIPVYGAHISLFTLLAGTSSILLFKMNSQMNTMGNDSPGAAQMKMFQYFMPISLMFIFNSYACALTYYYFLSNIITFFQQWSIKKFFIDEDKIRQDILSNKAKPRKKSKFAAKLEEIQRLQEEMQAQQAQQKNKGK